VCRYRRGCACMRVLFLLTFTTIAPERVLVKMAENEVHACVSGSQDHGRLLRSTHSLEPGTQFFYPYVRFLAYPKATIASRFVLAKLHLHPVHCPPSHPY
jgi:hypothetical protein